MTNAQRWAAVDSDTSSLGLSSVLPPLDISSDPTMVLSNKITQQSYARPQKIEAMKNPFEALAPETEEVTIKGFVDGDTPILTDGTVLRVNDPLMRYDTSELPHEYKGVLPEWAAKNLPSWVPGTGNIQKSDYATDKQREQAALVKMKNIGNVTQQDVYDVGNRAQIQTVADLNLDKGQERQLVDMNSGGDIVDLSGKTGSLDLKVRVNKNRETVNGRQLTPLYNAQTGENVTAMHAQDPMMNAFAPGVPDPAQFSLKNVAKGAASGAIQVAGGLADMVTSGAAYAAKEAASAIGHPDWYSAADRDYAVQFLDKYKDSKWANEVTDYDPKYNQAQLGKALDSFKNGEYFGGIAAGAKAAPGTFADSIAYMAAVTTGIGTAGMIMSEINDSLEEFKKNNKQDITGTDIARIAAIDSAKVLLERLPFVHAIEGKAATVEAIRSLTKTMPEASRSIVMKEATKRAGIVGLNTVEEGLQEGIQGVMDYYNREYKTDVDKGLNTNEIYKSMIGGAGAGAMTGSIGQARDVVGMTGLSEVVGGMVGKVSDKPSTSTKSTKAATADTSYAEVTDAEKDHMVNTVVTLDDDAYDFKTNTKETLDQFYRAEDTFNRLAPTSKDPATVKEIKDTIDRIKNRILTQVDNIDDNSPFILKSSDTVNTFKLGSSEDSATKGDPEAAENLIEFVLENSPKINAKREAKLLKIAGDNGLALDKVAEMKSYYEVELEAVEGKRGYKGYERTIKALMAAPETNVKALDKAVKDAQGFLWSQENAHKELAAGIDSAGRIAEQVNSTGLKRGKSPERVAVKAKQKVGMFEFTINYEDVNGKWKVAPSAYNILAAKKRNIDGIVGALAHASKYIKEKKLDIDTGTSHGISVPAGKNAEAQKYRDRDAAFYDRNGVTKVILGSPTKQAVKKKSGKTSDYNKWNKDYRTLNLSKINKDEYTKDDVVLINAQAETYSEGKKVNWTRFVDKDVTKRIAAAQKVGATIVVDNDIIRRDPKNYARIVLLLGKYTKAGKDGERKYALVKTKDGSTKGGYVFKLETEAKVINEELTAKAKVVKEAAKVESAVKDELVLAMAANRLGTEGAKDRLAAAKKAAAAYFKDTASKTSSPEGNKSAAENMEAYANRVIDQTIKAGAVVLFNWLKKENVTFEEGTDEATINKVYIARLNARDSDAIKLLEKINGRNSITSKGLIALATQEAVNMINSAAEGRKIMEEWKAHVELLKVEGKTLSLDKWLKEKGYTPRSEIDLKDTISDDLGTVYGHDVAGKDGTTYVSYKRKKDTQKIVSTLELNLKGIMQVTNTTVLNTVDLDTILTTSPELKKLVDTAEAAITKSINLDKIKNKEYRVNKTTGNEMKDSLTLQELAMVDAPGLGLLLDSDGNINRRVVTALVLALSNTYKANGFMLSPMAKSREDVIRMTGAKELPIGANIKLAGYGMLASTLGTSLKSAIASQLGISRNPDSLEAKRYDQALTDLAQVAMNIGVEAGTLEYKNMDTDKYSTIIGIDNKIKTPGVTVSFITLAKGIEHGELAGQYDILTEGLPLEDSFRVEPEGKKPSTKQIEKRLEGIRNDKLGSAIPQESKDLMTKAMTTEHIADVTMIRDLLNDTNQPLIKAKMGYKELGSDTYNALSKDQKDIQEAINRDIDNEINELLRLTESGTDTVSMWFMIDFIRNGRYMYDSNTLNPQSQKQLTRWLIQAIDHRKTVSYEQVDGKHKFTVGGKDHTKAYMFALGQAFGFGVDKSRSASTEAAVTKILDAVMHKDYNLDKLFTSMLEGDVKLANGAVVKIEHIAHAHQAIAMLKDLKSGGTATTSLTAEIDAKTSGFGIKSLLMPIVGNVIDHLKKIGFDISGLMKPVTDYLDPESGPKTLDMYQTLGSGMKQTPLNPKDDKTKSVFKVGPKNLATPSTFDAKYNKLHMFLPKIENDEVTIEIRNLFKQPFMEFNYSAALTTIRKSLALSMAHKAAEAAMKVDKFNDLGFGAITGMNHAEYVSKVQTTNLDQIKVGVAGSDLETSLAAALDLIYGTQVEAAFKNEFGPAMQAQEVINQAFQAMFKMYKKVYDVRLAELREKNGGALSVGQYRELLKDLRVMFPSIRGPLAVAENYDEHVAIFSTSKAHAKTPESGTGPSEIPINAEWAKKNGLEHANGKGHENKSLQYEIKVFEEAMKAGSVIPIHYFDGALMAYTGNNIVSGLTMIHDAIMPPITELFSTAKMYNKGLYEMTFGDNQYSIVTELLTSLTRVKAEAEKTRVDLELDNKINVAVKLLSDEVGSKADKADVPFGEYLTTAIHELTLLDAKVTEGKNTIQEAIEKNGVNVSNLVTGDDEGSYKVDPEASEATNTKPNTDGTTKAATKAKDGTMEDKIREKAAEMSLSKDITDILAEELATCVTV